MNTKCYIADTARLFGSVLDHDTSETARGAGSKLELGYRNTERLWNKTYGVPYSRAGAMHRGPLPAPLLKTPASLKVEARSPAGRGLPLSSFAQFDGFSARLVFHVSAIPCCRLKATHIYSNAEMRAWIIPRLT